MAEHSRSITEIGYLVRTQPRQSTHYTLAAAGGLGEGLFLFIQPWYIGKLGADPKQIGGVLALAGLVTAALYLPGGIISDHLDRKRTMAGGYWGLIVVQGMGGLSFIHHTLIS